MILKLIMGILLFVLSSVYFYFFFKKLLSVFSVGLTNTIKVICLICALIVSSGCLKYLSLPAIIIYHFIIFNVLVNVILKIISVILAKNNKNVLQIVQKIICVGIIPILLVATVIVFGYNNINTVYETSYTISSNKLSKNYKFLLLSDMHFGTIQKTSVLKNSIDKFNSLNLDFVILDGDIIDEYTSKENMKLVFEEISKIQTTYGIYYVFGNHDRQEKTTHKSFTESEIIAELNKNNIKILSDSADLINNEIYLIGREDEQYNSNNRKDISQFLTEANLSNFIIVADHQPINAKENSNNNVDLQVSGHTHAFQVWPLGRLLNLFRFYTYGNYKINNFNLIVTSGFAGWGFPIRTEKHCEYVVVNLKKV